MITSYSNSQIKDIVQLRKKRKSRDEQGVFLAEGVKMFGETPRDRIKKVYIAQSFSADVAIQEKLRGLDTQIVADEVFKKASDTMSPQGILCVVRQRNRTAEQVLGKKGGVFLILEGIQDPGNLGTILRSAEGAGADGVVMDGETVDIYSPKAVRSTMGSIYRVPFARVERSGDAIGLLKENGIDVFAAHLKANLSYTQADYRAGAAFLIGSEGGGLKEETAALARHLIRIPMSGGLESLNAAVAASLLAYEAYRQRNPA